MDAGMEFSLSLSEDEESTQGLDKGPTKRVLSKSCPACGKTQPIAKKICVDCKREFLLKGPPATRQLKSTSSTRLKSYIKKYADTLKRNCNTDVVVLYSSSFDRKMKDGSITKVHDIKSFGTEGLGAKFIGGGGYGQRQEIGRKVLDLFRAFIIANENGSIQVPVRDEEDSENRASSTQPSETAGISDSFDEEDSEKRDDRAQRSDAVGILDNFGNENCSVNLQHQDEEDSESVLSGTGPLTATDISGRFDEEELEQSEKSSVHDPVVISGSFDEGEQEKPASFDSSAEGGTGRQDCSVYKLEKRRGEKRKRKQGKKTMEWESLRGQSVKVFWPPLSESSADNDDMWDNKYWHCSFGKETAKNVQCIYDGFYTTSDGEIKFNELGKCSILASKRALLKDWIIKK